MQKFRLPLWVLAWVAVLMAALVVLLANQAAVDRLLAATGLEKVLYPSGKNAPLVVQAPPASAVVIDATPLPAPEAETVLETPEPGTAVDAAPEAETPEPP